MSWLRGMSVGFAAFLLAVRFGFGQTDRLSPLWNGTWKENVARSSLFVPEVFAIARGADGRYVLAKEGGTRWRFACDGRTYPGSPDGVLGCKADGVRAFWVRYAGLYPEGRWEISGDGKRLTRMQWTTAPDGSRPMTTDVFARTLGSKGWVGTWKKVSSDETPTTYVEAVRGEELEIRDADGSFTIHARLDGRPVKLEYLGPGVAHRNGYQAEGPFRLHERSYQEGRVVAESVVTLAEDGRTMTEVHWDEGHEEQKVKIVFERQR